MSDIEDYKEVYNRYITLIAELHNMNVAYCASPSLKNGTDLRRVLRQLRIADKKLWDQSIVTTKAVLKARGKGRPKKEK
jgi:predicted transcriptional regulator